MKVILLILLFPICAYSQLKPKYYSNFSMKDCLQACHNQYTNGLGVSCIGLAGTIGGSFLLIKSPVAGIFVTGVFGALSIVGGIIMIDSHKWIGRAGVAITGNGVSLKIRI